MCVAGYGHIAPRTALGRVVTIVYAIVGIPLTLLTITNLGGFMATMFRFLYHNICCGLCCLCCRRKRGPPNAKGSALKYGHDAENGDPAAVEALTRRKSSKKNMEVTWRHGLRRVLKTADNKTVTVPIYVSLLLICSYIMFGAFLFTLWEDGWSFLVGSYFCFITLTTIGFGDFVPGTSVDSESQEKLVSVALYLIFGLSLIAMCFDLMQEEARAKCRALGRKMGILKKDESKGSSNNGSSAPPSKVPSASSALAVQAQAKADPLPAKHDSYSAEPIQIITYPRYPTDSPDSPEEEALPAAAYPTSPPPAYLEVPSPGGSRSGTPSPRSSPRSSPRINKRRDRSRDGTPQRDPEAWEPLPDTDTPVLTLKIQDLQKSEPNGDKDSVKPLSSPPGEPPAPGDPPSPLWVPNIVPPTPPQPVNTNPGPKRTKGFALKKSKQASKDANGKVKKNKSKKKAPT